MGKKKSKKGKKKGKGGGGDGDSAEAVAAARAQSELLALRSKLGDFFGGGLFNQNMSRRLWRASQIPFAVECGRSAFLTLLVTA